MIDPTKTTPEKLAEMNDSLLIDNTYLRTELKKARDEIKRLEDAAEHGPASSRTIAGGCSHEDGR